MDAPICPYCGATSVLRDDTFIYGSTYGGKVYVCANFPACNAYVGCHRGSVMPFGRMADAELRRWKMMAHDAFDRMWKTRPGPKSLRRNEAYAALSRALKIPPEEAHIGMFDVEQCKAVVREFRFANPRFINEAFRDLSPLDKKGSNGKIQP